MLSDPPSVVRFEDQMHGHSKDSTLSILGRSIALMANLCVQKISSPKKWGSHGRCSRCGSNTLVW